MTIRDLICSVAPGFRGNPDISGALLLGEALFAADFKTIPASTWPAEKQLIETGNIASTVVQNIYIYICIYARRETTSFA